MLLDFFRTVGGLYALTREKLATLDLSGLISGVEAVRSQLAAPSGSGLKATRAGAELTNAVRLLGTTETQRAQTTAKGISPNPDAPSPTPSEQREAREQLHQVEEQVVAHIRQAILYLQELYQA
jgi:hypothetical protein